MAANLLLKDQSLCKFLSISSKLRIPDRTIFRCTEFLRFNHRPKWKAYDCRGCPTSLFFFFSFKPSDNGDNERLFFLIKDVNHWHDHLMFWTGMFSFLF